MRHDFLQRSLRFGGRTVKERGFFSDPCIASLAPLSGFIFPPWEKMNSLTRVYSTICKAKWQSTVVSIPFLKDKLKKDLFHKINSEGEKIKMNGRGREGNQDNKWGESSYSSARVSRGKQLFAECVFSLSKLGQHSVIRRREDKLLRHKI